MNKILIGILAILGITTLISVSKANAANITKVVAPTNMATSFGDLVANPKAWFFYNDETDIIDGSLGSFITGPAIPPEGDDSVQISVTGTQRRNLATYQFAGTKLADITELKFSTYNPSAGNGGSVNRSGYLNFNVDFDGTDTWQKRLVYVPSQNGTVQQDTWQEWDAINGGNALWSWSGFSANGNKWPDGDPNPNRTWNNLLNSFSDIAIRTSDPWLGIRVGEPYNDGYTENIDAFKFGTSDGTTTFDFEAIYPVSGVITNPVADGNVVSGLYNFTATYDDGDEVNDDAVQWAIRAGTCAAGTGTVSGNVDTYNDPFTWDGTSFSASVDTAGFAPGNYCFVFNPTDDPGQEDVRVTRNFIVDAPPPINPFPVPAQCDQNIAYNLIEGTNGGDVLNGTAGPDLILAKGGSDVVNGKGGNDCIDGGAGSDVLRGDGGDDVLLGGNGSDALYGGAGNDKLYGQAGSDSLRGDGGNDLLDGQAGSDAANGGAGNDTCIAEAKAFCEA